MDKAWLMIEEVFNEHCNACCRYTGKLCKNKPIKNLQTGRKIRCRLHGGLSSGPKTPEGKAMVAEARRRSGHMTSPDRIFLGLGFLTETKEDLRRLIRKKNNKQAYLRRKYGDRTIKL